MNRRTFFKRVAATCAAAIVAPTALVKARTGWGNDVGGKWPSQAIIGSCDDKNSAKGRTVRVTYYDEFSRLDPKKFKGWKNYTAEYKP